MSKVTKTPGQFSAMPGICTENDDLSITIQLQDEQSECSDSYFTAAKQFLSCFIAFRNQIKFNKLGIAFIFLILISCKEKEPIQISHQEHTKFDTNNLLIKEDSGTKKVQGQVLYMPVYSNIPSPEMRENYNMSAFLAIHNTDFINFIKVTKVLFFDNDGKLISTFLKNDTVLNPLGALSYYIPQSNQNGTGANFIVEWVADTLVTEPLIESVMVGFTNGQGVSFISQGKVIRELK